jgi:Type II/IV secretion system protein
MAIMTGWRSGLRCPRARTSRASSPASTVSTTWSRRRPTRFRPTSTGWSRDRPRSSSSATPSTTRRSSSSCIRWSRRPSSRAPYGNELRVRFRIDGVLASSATVPRRMVRGVISRIKIMADLDISERRLPQDGRVGLNIDSHHVDVRVVTLPSVHGESVVMRILDKDSVGLDLDELGMLEEERDRYEQGPLALLWRGAWSGDDHPRRRGRRVHRDLALPADVQGLRHDHVAASRYARRLVPADSKPTAEPGSDDQRCGPCRGTGEVISTPGGQQSTVTCPWCEGSGRRLRDHDAQRRESSPAALAGFQGNVAHARRRASNFGRPA